MVATCAFFVCKLVLLLLVTATLRLLVAATLRLIDCGLFAALYVQRVCRPSCRLFLMGAVAVASRDACYLRVSSRVPDVLGLLGA